MQANEKIIKFEEDIYETKHKFNDLLDQFKLSEDQHEEESNAYELRIKELISEYEEKMMN